MGISCLSMFESDPEVSDTVDASETGESISHTTEVLKLLDMLSNCMPAIANPYNTIGADMHCTSLQNRACTTQTVIEASIDSQILRAKLHQLPQLYNLHKKHQHFALNHGTNNSQSNSSKVVHHLFLSATGVAAVYTRIRAHTVFVLHYVVK